ncbi:MAG: hypothetical protein K2X69_00355 [Silvanigrellaceae bacterium]|nr:hypothetical protein [Silvanigrellaceae bacterium]
MKANVSLKANNETAIPVDFVFIFKDKAFDDIKKISAYDWFLKKDQFYNDYAVNEDIQILSYELVPGQHFELKKFKPNHDPTNLVIFANYYISGEHRAIIKEYSHILLNLNENSFSVKELK